MFFEATTPNAVALQNRYGEALAAHASAGGRPRLDAAPEEVREALNKVNAASDLEEVREAFNKAHRMAELSFRKLCDEGFPPPSIRDPNSGEILELSRGKWCGRTNWSALPGFHGDFVWEHDLTQPGPNAAIGGKLRPVFFDRAKFDAFMNGRGSTPQRRGPKDRYDWKKVEELVFELMDDRGDFSADDDWNCQGCLVKALRDRFFDPLQQSPATSRLYVRVAGMLIRWRSSKAVR